MRLAYPGLIYTMSNVITGEYAQRNTRDDIWRGMYERRTFAATNNQRILLNFEFNGEPMGGELQRGGIPDTRIAARVSGTAPILRVDVLKNSKPLYSTYPSRKPTQWLRIVWGDNIYQRCAATGMCHGKLEAESGGLRLERVIHRDQAFEEYRQVGGTVTWFSADVSNNRDGVLVDISKASGSLHFTLDDSSQMGTMNVRIPLDQLKRDGYFAWSKTGPVKHP